MLHFTKQQTVLVICEEEKLTGQCQGKFPRYWYNAKKKVCERFIYTGCKGNRNQFRTKEECKRTCLPGYQGKKVGKL